jgi:hypothetical protein
VDAFVSLAGGGDASVGLFQLGRPFEEMYAEASWGGMKLGPIPYGRSMEVYLWLAESAGGRNFDLSASSVYNAEGPVLSGLRELLELGSRSLFSVRLEASADGCLSTGGSPQREARGYLLAGRSERRGAFAEQRIEGLVAAVAEWLNAEMRRRVMSAVAAPRGLGPSS